MHRTFRVTQAAVVLCASGLAAEPVDFSHEVLPLLRDRCAKCHADGEYKGGFSIDTRAKMLGDGQVLAGESTESELFLRVASTDPEERMPPKGDPLSAEEIDLLRRWIDEGAAWEEGFTFRRDQYRAPLGPRRPELPAPVNGSEHPVDRLLGRYAQEHDIDLPPPAPDHVFLRRACLDITGLLPDPGTRAWFENSTDPRKRELLVTLLLDEDQAWAEHWLTFWNDLLRNDYVGTGYIDGGRKAISQWLYSSLRSNKPYDQMVRQLISPSPESEGFIRGIQWRGNVNASQTREVQFAQNVAQVFLGENLKCASCHDSFIDDWKLADAYGLAAVVSEGPLELYRCDQPTGEIARAAFPFPELGEIDAEASREARLGRLAEIMTSAENGRLARTIVNRIWQRLMGRGLVEPVDQMSSRPWSEDLLDFLAADFQDRGYDLRALVRTIATSEVYRARSVPSTGEELDEEWVFTGLLPRRMSAEQFIDAVWQVTGTAPEKPGFEPAEGREGMVRAGVTISDLLMRALGRPNREQVVTTRPAQLTTLQALALSNGEELQGMVARGARRWTGDHPGRPAGEWAEEIFRITLGRPPRIDEREAVEALFAAEAEEAAVADLLWTLFMLPEFQIIR